jgi:hypothetical protein
MCVDELIAKMRAAVKKDSAVKAKFMEYGVSLNEIDTVPICFCELDVSAKTKNRKIYLNQSMLSRENVFEFAMPYAIHEVCHLAQQISGASLNKSKTDDYLDKPSEVSAFQLQVDYKKRHEGPEKANEYVDKLLDYHDIKGPERKEKAKQLLDE